MLKSQKEMLRCEDRVRCMREYLTPPTSPKQYLTPPTSPMQEEPAEKRARLVQVMLAEAQEEVKQSDALDMSMWERAMDGWPAD